MAQSVLNIYKMAVSLVGGQAPTAVGDGSKGDTLCTIHYEPVRDRALMAHNWQWATEQAALTKDATDPTFGYEFRYDLPSGCLKVIRMSDDSYSWRVQGGHLFTDADSDDADVEIEYIKQVTDPTLFSPGFYMALPYGLAEAIAIPLLGARTASQIVGSFARNFTLYLDQAMSADAQQWNEALDVDEDSNDSWLAARS